MRTALYRHFNDAGVLLYVGISLKPFQRLDQHANGSHWYWQIANMTVEYFDTRGQAEEAERHAIKTEKPMHNIVHASDEEDITPRKLERKAIRSSERMMFPPRGMRREIAAYYIGISPSLFDLKRKEGVIPEASVVCGVKVWDRETLDKLFSVNENDPSSYWDKVCGFTNND